MVRSVIAHHYLRPVDHGGGVKGEGVPPRAQGVPLLHQHGPLGGAPVELAEQVHRLPITDDGSPGVADQQVAQGSGVVGLHVVDEYIVQPPALEGVLQVLEELVLDRPVHRVEEHRLLIQQQVGVVGHPPGDRVVTFKAGALPVVAADPDQILCHVPHTMHIINLLSYGKSFCSFILPHRLSRRNRPHYDFLVLFCLCSRNWLEGPTPQRERSPRKRGFFSAGTVFMPLRPGRRPRSRAVPSPWRRSLRRRNTPGRRPPDRSASPGRWPLSAPAAGPAAAARSRPGCK